MLDRSKFIQLLTEISDRLFSVEQYSQLDLALKQWKTITGDLTFADRATGGDSSFLIPRWQGNLADIIPVAGGLQEYAVLGVDGSQIYPDRHISGVGCFLINTGGCFLQYGRKSSVILFSEPRVMLPEQVVGPHDGGFFGVDLVDLTREAYEFEMAFLQACRLKDSVPAGLHVGERRKFVDFFDGSLIFWHLESKQPEVRDRFLQIYLGWLQKFYDQAILIAGYISMPKSRELVNLIRLGLCRFDRANCIACHSSCTSFPCQAVDMVLDAQLCNVLLPLHARTTIFMSTSKVTESYPEHLRPCFWYLNVGNEVVRIEVPAWITNDPSAVELICQAAIDQAAKGYGYPVVLAESHEQAVIRGADRDFFYHVLGKYNFDHQRRMTMSPKSLKKKGLGF